MPDPATLFITRFHSLEGLTLSDRKRNLYHLLNEHAHLRGHNQVVEAISAALKPATFLEQLYRVEVLIYFRRTRELLEVLQQGHDVLVSKVVKQRWFFVAAFAAVGVEELVTGILPTMSYPVRMKVLNKLSQHLQPEHFDQVFDAVLARYGIFVAEQFLLGCTPAKIRQLLQEHQVKLNQGQVRILYGKAPDVVEFYFTDVDTGRDSYCKFFRFLYGEDRNMYEKLHRKCAINLKLGRRLTKKFMDAGSDNVVARPREFFNVLDMKAVVRKLGKDSEKMFRNTLPSFDKFATHDRHVLKYFATKYHYNLIFKTIPNHYHMRYVDHPKLITEDLVQCQTDPKGRVELAQVVVDRGEDWCIKYLTVDQSIPLLKQKINVTKDIYQRRDFVANLVNTCKINNVSVREVIEYFTSRHKNDDEEIFDNFIGVFALEFPRQQFDEEMWTYYLDLIMLYVLKHDDKSERWKRFQNKPHLKFILTNNLPDQFAYLYFLHQKGEPIVDLLPEVVPKDTDFDHLNSALWGQFDQDFEKTLLMHMIDTASMKELQEEQVTINCCLIEAMELFNRAHPVHSLDFRHFPFLEESYMFAVQHLKEPSTFVRTLFRKTVFTKKATQLRIKHLDLYWQRFDVFKERTDFHWFLRHDPRTAVEQLETLLADATSVAPHRLGLYRRYGKMCGKSTCIPRYLFVSWYSLKKLSHLGLPGRTIEFCKSRLELEEHADNRTHYVGCLSVVMELEEYVAMADQYRPKARKFDLKKEEDVNLYKLQCAIAEKFKYTHHRALPSLLHYCKGDYFHNALESLYSLMYRTPEQELGQYLTHLAKEAVSVRKHSLYFVCELSTVQEVDAMITHLNQSEGVLSLQKYLFSSTVKYFLKNPQQRFFDMLTTNMLFITKEDKESHKLILEKFGDIPWEYRGRYFQLAWEHLENTIDKMHELIGLKDSLLNKLEWAKAELDLQFGLRIIKTHLCPLNVSLQLTNALNFAFQFLLDRSKEEEEEVLNTVLASLESAAFRMPFFHSWYSLIMNYHDNGLPNLHPFIDCYERNVDRIRFFQDHIQVYLLRVKLTVARDDFEALAERFLSFADQLTSQYGHRVTALFWEIVKKNLDYFVESRNQFCLFLLKRRMSVDVVAFVLETIRNFGEELKVYNDVLREIQKVPDEGIQIYLHWKFKDYFNTNQFRKDRRGS